MCVYIYIYKQGRLAKTCSYVRSIRRPSYTEVYIAVCRDITIFPTVTRVEKDAW